MLAVTYIQHDSSASDAKSTQSYQFGLLFDGDYLDVYPLFKFCNTSNPASFARGSEFRVRYTSLVQESLGHIPVSRVDTKPKRMFYHRLIVKPALHALGLLELEGPIASYWDMDELPMLERDQFDYWDVMMTLYDHDGTPRRQNPVRIFQRRFDKWINLTSCTTRYDGDDVVIKRPNDIAKNNQILFRQLWSITHSPAEVAAQDALLAAKDSAPEAKKAMAKCFVDTDYNRGETWCHPAVFLDTMMILSVDFRMKTFNAIIANDDNSETSHGGLKKLLIPNIFDRAFLIPSKEIETCGIINRGDQIDARFSIRSHTDRRVTKIQTPEPKVE